MTDKPVNPPAFPNNVAGKNYSDYVGMSLRDYFAGQALVGLLANPAIEHCGKQFELNIVRAYDYADKMLQARGE